MIFAPPILVIPCSFDQTAVCRSVMLNSVRFSYITVAVSYRVQSTACLFIHSQFKWSTAVTKMLKISQCSQNDREELLYTPLDFGWPQACPLSVKSLSPTKNMINIAEVSLYHWINKLCGEPQWGGIFQKIIQFHYATCFLLTLPPPHPPHSPYFVCS